MVNDATSDSIRVNLPGTLIAQIDAQVGAGFVDRQEFIRAAIRHYAEYLQSNNNGTGSGQLIA